jgi:hypothetical protein
MRLAPRQNQELVSAVADARPLAPSTLCTSVTAASVVEYAPTEIRDFTALTAGTPNMCWSGATKVETVSDLKHKLHHQRPKVPLD